MFYLTGGRMERVDGFGVGRGTGGSKTYRVYRVFFLRKCFIVTGGRVDGRVDGEQKCPLIFFILRYIKH